jgi:hypothetical protein
MPPPPPRLIIWVNIASRIFVDCKFCGIVLKEVICASAIRQAVPAKKFRMDE